MFTGFVCRSVGCGLVLIFPDDARGTRLRCCGTAKFCGAQAIGAQPSALSELWGATGRERALLSAGRQLAVRDHRSMWWDCDQQSRALLRLLTPQAGNLYAGRCADAAMPTSCGGAARTRLPPRRHAHARKVRAARRIVCAMPAQVPLEGNKACGQRYGNRFSSVAENDRRAAQGLLEEQVPDGRAVSGRWTTAARRSTKIDAHRNSG